MNFNVTILILKVEGKCNIFWHITLYYFKKGENTTEMQKKKKRNLCSVEKVLWLINCVKSSLWNFMLKISLWTVLLCQV